MHGFHGAYLRVDLSSGTSTAISISPEILRRTLGGVGLGAWLLHRESPAGADAYAPESPLILAFSPLVGTGLTTSAKFAVIAKSPLTGGICDALASSHFAIAGKASGYDACVFVGACEKPSEWVSGELRPSLSWGRSAEETSKALAGEGRTLAIGLAGENRVRYAGLSADGRHAGRGGLGAVMGSKNLKAIVLVGDQETSVANAPRVDFLAKRLRERAAGEATAKYRELGTVSNLLTFDRLGLLPTRNFRESQFEGAEALAVENWREDRRHTRTSCASCTIGCEHRYAGGDGRPVRIEYETLFALGPLIGLDDPDIVLAAARRCDEVGLDTISLGATLAFAMECGEKGLLADGPRFGDAENLLSWIDDIAHRRGLGDLLAEGSKRVAAAVGQGAIAFAPQVKGLELPGYEPRGVQALALGFAVGTRGADHNRSGAYEVDFSEEADRLRGDARSVTGAVASENRAALIDSMILCKFVRGAFGNFYSESAEILSAVTGFDLSGAELEVVAERIVTLRKAFNVREGWQPEDDTLPDRFLTEPLSSGPAVGVRLPRERLEALIRGYNGARGWALNGYPNRARIELMGRELDLNLAGVAEVCESRAGLGVERVEREDEERPQV